MPRQIKKLMMLSTILVSAASGCALKPPKVKLCIHVAEQSKFRCKDPETGKHYDLSYNGANRFIATSPDDYKKVLDFVDDAMRELRGNNLFIDPEMEILGSH